MWEFINSSIITTVMGIFIGAWVSLYIVEKKKTADKKNCLLKTLFYELSKYSKPEELNEEAGPYYRTPQRNTLIWNIISSDVLEPKKDEELIICLYEMISWIENFNSANELSNLALIQRNDQMINFFSNGRNILYNKGYVQKERLEKILKEKYKICLSDVSQY